ncbi:MAG: sodium-dependent transporter [Candidatus Faecousia sp.]|nr:sodium-dependent transporter [Clostridiales bacterium]MCI6937842.1 sodium-dependent transporter [Clostridiales bacterium]MDD5883603.1 sodium-dependent transporter [Bacillota bacterium]MDY4599118.1 sodium-dependent transporter [Candidatus Faecousia sp.]
MQREHLGSRLGFLLLSAGCAIGIGNVWKFPWMTGQYGGGAFVLIYLLFLLALGVPVLTMEFAMGRAAQKSPLKMYGQLKPGSKWGWHGYVCLLGNIVLMMFYTTVAGWMLQYFVDTAAGVYAGLDTAGIEAKFGEMLASPGKMAFYMGIVVVFGFSIISLGVQKGLERVTKWMMMALILLMWVLALHSMTLSGGSKGLSFYLIPDFQRMADIGVGNVIVGAMNQAFFTLSLGIGAMAIFGSYIGKDHALMGEAVRVSLLDTMVALCSGLIIFPACFAYGVDVNSGPALIFVTLPNVFNHITLGRFWGSLFFLFLTFAAFSTVLAVFENIVCCVSELTGWNRRKTCLICCVGIFLLSLPCLLGYNLWQNVRPIAGHDILDSEDFLVSNIMLPLGSLIFVLFCTTRYGWGWEKFMKEANEGTGLKVAKWMRPYMTYVLPVIVFVIFVIGLVGFFRK